MNRRSLLKFLGLAPLVPAVAAAPSPSAATETLTGIPSKLSPPLGGGKYLYYVGANGRATSVGRFVDSSPHIPGLEFHDWTINGKPVSEEEALKAMDDCARSGRACQWRVYPEGAEPPAWK